MFIFKVFVIVIKFGQNLIADKEWIIAFSWDT